MANPTFTQVMGDSGNRDLMILELRVQRPGININEYLEMTVTVTSHWTVTDKQYAPNG